MKGRFSLIFLCICALFFFTSCSNDDNNKDVAYIFTYFNKNGAAVLEAYGFPKDATKSDIVARLLKMYQELTS